MDFLQALGNKILVSFSTLLDAFFGFLPGFLTAVIVFVVGWVIATALGKVAGQIIRAIKIDSVLEKMGFKKVMDRAGLKLNTGLFFDELIKWFVILVALLVAVDILQLQIVGDLLKIIVLYIPNVIVAVLILIAGVLISNLLEKSVVASLEAARMKSSKILGKFTRWFILIFALLIAISALQIGDAGRVIGDFVSIIITGVVAAFAISFGLAGKDIATQLLNKAKNDLF